MPLRVGVTADPQRLFTERRDAYARFIRWVRYPSGLRSFFVAWPPLRSGLRALDAGCGTGALLLALRDAMARRGVVPSALHGFDLTPAMLDRFRETLQRRAIDDVELAQANVLALESLPASWTGYDVIVSASMLEYVPRDRLGTALRDLRARLADDGRRGLFITRRNALTRVLVGAWWASNLYTAAELTTAFGQAGFSTFAFRRFPPSARHLDLWGHVVEARR